MPPTPPARLPLPLRPCADEIFSSWLVRLAAAHGLRTRSLCSLVLGRQVEFNLDLDGPVNAELLGLLAVRTGFDPAALRAGHSLVGFEGRLFPRLKLTGANPWLLPLGRFYTRRPALQFCPLCLRQPPAYFRRAWRLSLFSVCPVHGTDLQHVCPACAAPVDPVRGDICRGQGAAPLCWQCGFDLRRAEARPADAADARLATDLQRTLTEGTVRAPWPPGIGAADFFDGLNLLCARLLRRLPRLARWRELAGAAAGLSSPYPRRPPDTSA